MANQKEKENFAAQLRGLRLILGKDNKPISGEAFAEMSGIALGTVRAIENGLRKLSAEDDKKLTQRLCAKWSPKRKRWVDARDEKTAYTRQLYDRYTQAIYSVTSPLLRDLDLQLSTLPTVFYVFRKLPDKAYHLALLDLHDHLRVIAEKSDAPPEVFEALKALAPVVKPHQNPNLPLRIEEVFVCPDFEKVNEYVSVPPSITEAGKPDMPFKVVK